MDRQQLKNIKREINKFQKTLNKYQQLTLKRQGKIIHSNNSSAAFQKKCNQPRCNNYNHKSMNKIPPYKVHHLYQRLPLSIQRRQKSKLQLVLEDRRKFPFKYKILCDELGFSQMQAYQLQNPEVKRIQEDYSKYIGNGYMKQSNSQAKNQFYRKFIHDEQRYLKRIRQSKSQQLKRLNKRVENRQLHLKQLKIRQGMLGKKIYKKVAEHLQTNQQNLDYYKKIRNQGEIDNNLIGFLFTKIERAQTEFS